MSPQKNWLSRFRPKQKGKNIFEDWPPAPPVIRVPLGEPGRQDALAPRDDLPQISYNPAIVIGLGPTGGYALRQWVDLLEETHSGRQEMLRAALIADSSISIPQTECLTLHHFDPSKGTLNINRDTFMRPADCRREETHRLFCQPRQFTTFQSFLQVCLADLRKDVRVIIVGSLRESVIGVLGEVLQALRLIKNVDKSPYSSITALLSFASPAPMLDDDEMYAALREIGRFTYSGWHKMKAQPAMATGGDVIRSALLDHFFVVDWQGLPSQDIDMRRIPFEQGVAQVLSEAIFTLLHPSANDLWMHLVNDLAKSGNARKETRKVFVTSLGIASLHIPFTEIKEYVSARLAYATLYGERAGHPNEGLISSAPPGLSVQNRGEQLAKRWLRNGPCAHPLFEWLLAASDPSYFRFLPGLSPAKFEGAFQTQVTHGLQALLNDSSENGHLSQARSALHWLSGTLKRWGEWLQISSAATEMVTEFAILKNLIEIWHVTINDLDDQIQKWEDVLFRKQTENSLFPSLGVNNPLTPPVISEYLKRKLKQAQDALKTAADGQIRRSLTADLRGHLVEVEKYYSDTIRPELSQYGLNSSAAFRLVRQRLGWWLSLKPGYPPQLYMICMPQNIAGEGDQSEPPESARYTPDQAMQLVNTLLQITSVQEQRLAADLTGVWMQQQLEKENQIAFLRQRASGPFLLYDENIVAAQPYTHYAEERFYLIAHDKSTANKYEQVVFFGAPALPNGLAGGEPGRLTALSIWLNIPINAINAVHKAYESYFHQERVHIYPQERLATFYERLFRSYNNGKWEECPPEFSMPLVDLRLVSLFCQAVICGIIDIVPDESGKSDYWAILLDDDLLQNWKLVDVDNRGLWSALESFALKKTHDPELNQDPTSPFHPEHRARFFENLDDRVRLCRQSPQFDEKRQKFRKQHLDIWQQRGERDALARSFARLLQTELDEPSWRE
jgi:hypothetical protein